VTTCRRGTTRTCPRNSGRRSRKAITTASSNTRCDGASPATIEQNAQLGTGIDRSVTAHPYDRSMFPRRRSMKPPLLGDVGPLSVLPAGPFYGLDIETDTTVDGLDPARSAIVAVALSTADDDQVFLGPEHSILTDLEQSLGQLPPGVIITWNGSAFDMPFLADRARRHDVNLSLRLRPDPTIVRRRDCLPGHHTAYRAVWGDHSHLDGYLLYRADVGRSLGLSCGLKALSRLVGLAPVEVDRSRIHELDAAAVSEYVASDARLARLLVLRRSPGHEFDSTGDRSPVALLAAPAAVAAD
jgi:DNA polymerase family B, exonuclease domain